MNRNTYRRMFAALLCGALLLADAGALTSVSTWAQADVAAAKASGLEPAALASAKATAPITRAEFCAVALSTYEAVVGAKAARSTEKPFTDCADPAVATAYALGLVSGRGNGKFAPADSIQRQDLCVMLGNVLTAAHVTTATNAKALSAFSDAGKVQSYAKDAVSTMVDRKVMSGVSNGKQTVLSPSGTATREQALIMAGRFSSAFRGMGDPEAPTQTGKPSTPDTQSPDPEVPTVPPVTTPEPPATVDPEPPSTDEPLDPPSADVPTSDAEKMTLVYGAGGEKYETAEQAAANMVEIEVPVWRLQPDGSKKAGKAELTVQKNLAPIYRLIFSEIYDGKEQFPIKDVGCYAWRSGEHAQGTAVDLNYMENMEATINEDGTLTPTTGTHWTPGADPYSIPENGDVVRAFSKYGFSWGGNAWPRKRDYMHFSYFGR